MIYFTQLDYNWIYYNIIIFKTSGHALFDVANQSQPFLHTWLEKAEHSKVMSHHAWQVGGYEL